MPHRRNRFLAPAFKKQLKFWPVVALLGPRQCGKSTFLRELIWDEGMFHFESLDFAAVRERASSNPFLFLSVDKYPLVIDEVQKVPKLFDEIKAVIDQKRKPGQFVLSGSVQFSKKMGIRESLTGRIAIIRMEPMTLLETLDSECRLKPILKYLELGGMPGVCFVRERTVRENYWEQWLDTTCERDLKSFAVGKLSGDLARKVIECSAKLEMPNVAEMAKALRMDSRRVKSHVEALEALFVLIRVEPNRRGVGKSIYLPFDTGLANHLGALKRRCWQVWFLNEYLTRERFRGNLLPKLPEFYLTTRGSFIDFVVNDQDFVFYSELPSTDRRSRMTLDAVLRKYHDIKVTAYCATDEKGGKIGPRAIERSWSAIVT